MVVDVATRAPATFDANETRMELDFGDPRSTRISASSTSLDIDTFAFSMIVDPTKIENYTTLLQKESAAGNTFANYQRVGWQVQHTENGNIEFVVRGTNPGTKDFYGSISVMGASSGIPVGDDYTDPATYFHIAGGYNSTDGSAYLYVTQLGGTITSLTGSTATFDSGAAQDTSALSVGSAKSGSDYVSFGAGFDIADVQIYDALQSESDLLFLANNPGVAVPEPGTAILGGMGLLILFRRRRA